MYSASVLIQALTVHDVVDKGKDAEWIHVLLKFLKVYVGDMGRELLVDGEDQKAYIQALLAALQKTAEALTSGACILYTYAIIIVFDEKIK